MTWTKINPDDPTTFPESGKKVNYVLFRNGREHLCVGWWNEDGRETWTDTEEDGPFAPEEYFMGEVTHWQPLPPLPGDER